MNIEGLIADLSNLCLSYLLEEEHIYISKKWNKFNKYDVCEMAAKNGWLDLLKWVRQNGCEWNSHVCSNAAHSGHLEVLKWARQNGCEWNRNVCMFASKNKHYEVLKWTKLNGCVCGGEYHEEI